MDNSNLEQNRNKWLTALRSGKYKKGVGQLKNSQGEYCCLGVLAEIAGCEEFSVYECYYFDENRYEAPEKAMKFVGLKTKAGYCNNVGRSLSGLNDDGLSFPEIADFIEQHTDSLFHSNSTEGAKDVDN